MKPSGKPWTLSSIILALAGTTLIAAGLYFILLRPPLLPEDVRYMGLSAAELDAVRPRLEAWLTQVFRVMGGYVIATGVLTVTLAATSFRTHHWGAGIGALSRRRRFHRLDGRGQFHDRLGLQMASAGDGVVVGGEPWSLLVRNKSSEPRGPALTTSRQHPT